MHHTSQGAGGRRSKSGNYQISCKGGDEATARGIPVIALWPMPNIDARPKTGTAPDGHSVLRIKHAHERLLTDVSRLRPHLCTIISDTSAEANASAEKQMRLIA
jgi:hypothetical protein